MSINFTVDYFNSTNGYTGALWGDCPAMISGGGVNPQSGVYTDFGPSSVGGLTVAGTDLPNWSQGTTLTTTNPGGAWRSTIATANDVTVYNSNRLLFNLTNVAANIPKRLWCESVLKTSGTTNLAFFVGLHAAPSAILPFADGATTTLVSGNFIGMGVLSGTPTVVRQWHDKTSGLQTNATTWAHAANTIIKLGMKFTGTMMELWVNGALSSTTVLATATNFPLDLPMTYCVVAKTAGTSTIVDLVRGRCVQET